MDRPTVLSPNQPQLGCLLLLAMRVFVFLVPFILLDAAQWALHKLHLSPPMAVLTLIGIFVGGLINIPIFVIKHDRIQPRVRSYVHAVMGWTPLIVRQSQQSIVAINIGGCVIPVVLAVFEASLVFSAAPLATKPLLTAVLVNIVGCYLIARPVPGLGIAMPPADFTIGVSPHNVDAIAR